MLAEGAGEGGDGCRGPGPPRACHRRTGLGEPDPRGSAFGLAWVDSGFGGTRWLRIHPSGWFGAEIDTRRLVSFAGKGLPPGHDDLAFLVHGLLSSLFGERAVQPFRILADQRREVTIVGYSRIAAEELREHAKEFADPLAHASVDWSGFATKDMPESWQPDRRLGFEVRLCPVVRLSSARTVDWKGERRPLPAGAEIDAFVHARHLRGEGGATREDVYGRWLQQRLGVAAELHTAKVTGFRRLRLIRRSHAAPARHACSNDLTQS